MELEFSSPVDCIADFTYNFYWQHLGAKLEPDTLIPYQEGSAHTYRDVVETLKRGEDVHIAGDVGHRLCSSFGVDLRFFSGTGGSITVGSVFVDGNVDTRMGISMGSGAIYVAGEVKAPIGNVIEVASDRAGYRKYRSITDIVCGGAGDDVIVAPNILSGAQLNVTDAIVRDTIGARCTCDARICVAGDVDLSTGILMERGTVIVTGNAGMNSGALLSGGTVIIRGNSGAFAGIDMRSGALVIGGVPEGYLGAKMRGGTIYARGARALPPSKRLALTRDDVALVSRALGVAQLQAMMFNKFVQIG
jgi:formylmethanofuran dehydrogenase subunit C